MNDKTCFATLIGALNHGFKQRGLGNITILRSHQPKAQKRPQSPFVQLAKLSDTPIGQPFKSNIFCPHQDDYLHREIQILETSYKISCFVRENPSDEKGLTASDLCVMAASILAHDDALESMGKQGVRPMRFGPVLNPQFENETGVYEANPCFDLVLTRQLITETRISAAQTLQGKFA